MAGEPGIALGQFNTLVSENENLQMTTDAVLSYVKEYARMNTGDNERAARDEIIEKLKGVPADDDQSIAEIRRLLISTGTEVKRLLKTKEAAEPPFRIFNLIGMSDRYSRQ